MWTHINLNKKIYLNYYLISVSSTLSLVRFKRFLFAFLILRPIFERLCRGIIKLKKEMFKKVKKIIKEQKKTKQNKKQDT